jgi:nucleoid-associated protein YgaU
LPNGETSRRGADGSPDATAKADWGLPDATDESSISRILGLILVLVLVGVFSFVAYRKYNEARLHPQAVATTAENPATENTVAGNLGSPPASTGADPAPGAANTTAGAPHAFQQFEEPGNPNAAFHPTAGGSASGLPVAQSTTGQQAPGQAPTGQPVRPGRTPSSESEVNPFSDVASSASPSNGSTGKVAQPDANRSPSAASKSLASDDPRTDQSEPFFNEGGSQQTPSPTGRPGSPRADSSSQHKLAAAPTQNLFANENGGTDPAKSENADLSGRPIALQPQPVQAGQKDQTVQTRQTAPTQGVPTQSEPASNDLLNESPKTVDAGTNNRPATTADSVPARRNAPVGGLLDQDEPEPTTTRNESAPVASTSPGAAPAPPRTTPPTAQASSATTVHASQAQTAADTEDLFTAKRSDSAANAGSAANGGQAANGRAAPIPHRQTLASSDGNAGSAAGSTGMEATLNDAGDFYVVQPQDTFWTISRKKYGTARYFMALAQLNKAHVPDPTRMRPGVKVSTPPTEILETQFAQYLPKGSAIEVASGERQATKPTPTGFFVSADGKPMYRTGEKDTLSDIAARHLGRASRWIQVFEMNRDKLTSPNQLKVGTELALPADASNVALTNDNDDRR